MALVIKGKTLLRGYRDGPTNEACVFAIGPSFAHDAIKVYGIEFVRRLGDGSRLIRLKNGHAIYTQFMTPKQAKYWAGR